MPGLQKNGAGEGTRTLDINLGKVALYQLSYTREKRGKNTRQTEKVNGTFCLQFPDVNHRCRRGGAPLGFQEIAGPPPSPGRAL